MPETIYEQLYHLAGAAPDTTPVEFRFNPPAQKLDIFIFTNDALVSLTADGIRWTTERRMPAGLLASLSMKVAGLRIRNRVALSVADYDITGFGNPSEVVGKPFEATVAG